MVRLEDEDFAIWKCFSQTGRSFLIVAKGNYIRIDFLHDLKEILTRVTQFYLYGKVQLDDAGFALLLRMIRIGTFDPFDILVAGNYDKKFRAKGSGLLEEGNVARVKIVKGSTAQYALTH